MKKKIVITIIVVLLILGTSMIYVGVNRNNNEIIDIVEQSGDKEQNETHSGEDKEKVAEKELVEKYKLTDGYSYNEKDFSDINFNFVSKNEFVSGDAFMVRSDDEDVKIRFKIDYEKSNDDEGIGVTSIYINENENPITSNISTPLYYPDGIAYSLGVIDLDSSDKYKEMVFVADGGYDRLFQIYRIRKGYLELLYTGNQLNEENLPYYIGVIYNNFANKYIILDKYIQRVCLKDSKISLGYYDYANGKLEYVDRFLNGEKMVDNEGIFNEEFKKLTFESAGDGYNLEIKNSGENLKSGIKFRFLKMYQDGTYQIELLEDAKIGDSENEEDVLKSGTIIEVIG